MLSGDRAIYSTIVIINVFNYFLIPGIEKPFFTSE